jgi:transcriptional regulator with XRE-family HTH domain
MKDGAMKNRLRELRDRSRLTQQEVSTLTGYTITAISRHENGSRSLSEEAIAKYAALYKVPTHQLFVNPKEMHGDDDE